jgi:hypothetical protein
MNHFIAPFPIPKEVKETGKQWKCHSQMAV